MSQSPPTESELAMLRRLEPRLAEIYRRWGLPRAAAASVLERSVQEVRLRSRDGSAETRLLRAVERRCRAWREAADAATERPAEAPRAEPPVDDPETGA